MRLTRNSQLDDVKNLSGMIYGMIACGLVSKVPVLP